MVDFFIAKVFRHRLLGNLFHRIFLRHSFIKRKAPIFPERDFLGLAAVLGVHPALVAGQIQFKTGRYDLFRSHMAKIRDRVLPSAVVDGWGDVAPVGLS